jgi:hypothetical protein
MLSNTKIYEVRAFGNFEAWNLCNYGYMTSMAATGPLHPILSINGIAVHWSPVSTYFFRLSCTSGAIVIAIYINAIIGALASASDDDPQPSRRNSPGPQSARSRPWSQRRS